MTLAKIDTMGRITIPKEIRETMELQPGQLVDVKQEGNAITIRKVVKIVTQQNED